MKQMTQGPRVDRIDIEISREAQITSLMTERNGLFLQARKEDPKVPALMTSRNCLVTAAIKTIALASGF
jgi:hypothetical protein